MRVMAAIIDRQFEYHVDDVLVAGQVVAFPDGDPQDRHVVASVNRNEAIVILRTYFPVTARTLARGSQANDTFMVFEYQIVGDGDDAQVFVSDEASISIPVAPQHAKSEEVAR